MKIAILTSGILPVPAIQGGAVENLVDLYLEYNEHHKLHDITVYSVKPTNYADKYLLPVNSGAANHYYYIETQTIWAKFKKKAYQITHGEGYYHYTIEYYLSQALRHISKQHYDFIILENRPGYALKLKDYTEARLVYHLHNDLLNSQTKLGKQIYQLADRIITVSDFIGSRVKTINPTDTKCVTAYNGIDIEPIKSRLGTNEDVFRNRKALGFEPDDFIVSFSGRLIPEKGILPLIQAMRQIQEHKNIKLMVLGGYALGNSKEQTPFQKEIQLAAEGLNNIVFTGYVPYNEIGNYLNIADIAALPSIWEEPFGLTCVEAMAAGLPLITTRSGGIPEIANEQCAIFVERGERLVTQLASAILDLYQHPEKKKAMSLAVQNKADYFNKERYARDFFNALSTI